MGVYERFAELCEKRKCSVYSVAKATGIATAAFTQWKHGQYNFKHDKIQKIADFFGVTAEWLETGVESKGYYINDETAKTAQELFENKELRMLFDAAKDASPEDLIMVKDLLLRLKKE